MMRGIDVYHGNPSSTTAAAMVDAEFVIPKASEGQRYKDPEHDATVAAARAHGKLVGHYHFGWFGLPAIQQARHFVDAANPQVGDTMWLDVEREAGAPAAQWPGAASRVAFTLAFEAEVARLTGANCGHYANRSDWAELLNACTPPARAALLARPLWIADPSSPDGHPAISTPWVMQQVGIANNIDRDLFNGGPVQWKALGVSSSIVSPPTPLPTPVPNPHAKEDDPMSLLATSPQSKTVYVIPNDLTSKVPLDIDTYNSLAATQLYQRVSLTDAVMNGIPSA